MLLESSPGVDPGVMEGKGRFADWLILGDDGSSSRAELMNWMHIGTPLGRPLAAFTALGRGQAGAAFLQDKPVAPVNETLLHPASGLGIEPLH